MFNIEVMQYGEWEDFRQGYTTPALAQSEIDAQTEIDALQRAETGDLDYRFNYRVVRQY